MKKKITIFGSTGSIGQSTLDLIKHNPDKIVKVIGKNGITVIACNTCTITIP